MTPHNALVNHAPAQEPASRTSSTSEPPAAVSGDGLSLHVEPFGTTAGDEAVQRYVFGNRRLSIALLTYGATLQSAWVPDRHGTSADVLLGQADLAQYEALTTYFGATIGRYANRLAGGRFTLDGQTYRVPVNEPATEPVNALHGGPDGFNRRVWNAQPFSTAHEVGVTCTLTSPDGDQGFPGALSISVDYAVADHGELRIRYRATTDAPTVLNLTNHAYFNLAGESSGDVYAHQVQIRASRFTAVDAASIPLASHHDVTGTPFDFRTPTAIGDRIRVDDQQLLFTHGYDHNWVFDDGLDRTSTPVITVEEPATGRRLETFTDQPGVQMYTANLLTGSLVGPGGSIYRQGAALTLETQHFPDSPNRPDHPSTVLRPGQQFTSSTTYRFSAH